MRIIHFMAPLLAGVIFLSSCNRDTVALTYTNAKGEVEQLQNLVFRFNRSMVPDSLLNNWDSTGYVRFEPEIRGRFRWDAPDQLIFSPAAPLLPATSYKATISGEVLEHSTFDDVEDGDDIQFHTAPLQLLDGMVNWVLKDGASKVAVPRVQLRFNYPVDPEKLNDKLVLTVEGKPVKYSMHTLTPGDEVVIELEGWQSQDKTFDARVVIGEGLVPEGGRNKTEEKLQTQLNIPSPFILTVNEVESEHDGAEGIVRIHTSQKLTNAAISSFIQFNPAVKYSIEQTDQGLVLRSEQFSAEESYTYTIRKGLRGEIGGVLKEDYTGGIAFGELEADIQFLNKKAVYLSKRGSGNIEVRVTNVPKVKLVISKIYENNLLAASRDGYYPRDDDRGNEEDYEGYGDYEEYNESVAGDVIFTKVIDTRSLPKSGGARLLDISQFEDRLPDLKGIYHIMLRSTDDYWIRDSRFISRSDLGLIAREGLNKVFVFANSIKTSGPLDGVTVNVYGNNNQLVGTGATNADGVAEVNLAKKEFKGFQPAMIIAKTEDDFTYLPLNQSRVNTSRFDVGGKRSNASGLDAFVYPERDIYRPGEKMNFAVLVRDQQWKVPGSIPLKLKISFPNGREMKTFRKTLNEQGATEATVDISSSAITGTYLVEVFSSTDILLASANIMVEEFVPDRIKVTPTLNRTSYKPGETAVLNIHAVNFFGPPAANRNYETEVQIKHKNLAFKEFRDYEFDLTNLNDFSEKEVIEGKTSEEGNAVVSYEIPAEYVNMGLLQADFYTTVFDETGRPVSRLASADVFTQDVFYGMKSDDSYYYPLNQPVQFNLVSVNREGRPVQSSAMVKVIKKEYKTSLVKSGGYFRYESREESKMLVSQVVSVGSHTNFVYIPRSPGDYEVRVYRQGANSYVSKHFYSYGSWGGDQSSFQVNTEGHIDIEADKPSYKSGEPVKLLFKTPFSGRMLVTVEREGVMSYQYLTVNKRSASMELQVKPEYVPNIYVTATLIKAHEISDIPLTVAHGFQHVRVEEPKRKLPVQIEAVASSRSKSKQRILVKTTPGTYVTLAAVDNGVLQVTDFETPDPYKYYYQKQALEVKAYDMYPLLFPELRLRSSTGGDGDVDMDKRLNPVQAKRFQILSYWSGLRKTNGSGVAEFELNIGQFNGQVRLMAVAFKDNGFGSAEKTMQVADPLVVSSSLPRFLTPGDTVSVPVTISNTTGRSAMGEARMATTGPVKVMGSNTQRITVAPNKEERVVFRLVADPVVQAGKVQITVNALGEKFVEETEIAVRPASTLQKLTGSGAISQGGRHMVALPKNDFLRGSTDYKLLVSRSPVIEIADQLKWLVQYPYGCTEQTISAAFPQLYFGDLADMMMNARGHKQNAVANVMEAIRKIKMRQLYNGAVTLWDGGGQEDWWTTVYALHFLVEAKKAGFDVENSLMETMKGYLITRLRSKQTISYYYNRGQNKKIAPKEVAYSLYVLSLANSAQVSAMNYYKANPQLLALDSRYLLATSYALSGDRRSFSAFLPSSFSGEESMQQTGGSFYSETRDEAIALNALIDADPGNPQVPVMASHVAGRLKKERWLNTQERVFSFLALGKLARSAARSDMSAEIRQNGKLIGKVNGNDWQGGAELLQGGDIEIVTKGNGRLYYSWEMEGISASGRFVQEDQYIKVRRTFFDRNGKELTRHVFRQNELIIVRLSLEAAYSNPVENVVITDLLPAGFEIENPRTKDIPGMNWIKNAAEPLSMDVRDDRINFFVHAQGKPQYYYYAVRAVSTGRFRQGPVSADAMYNGEIHSYHGAGQIEVQ